jgi:signal peptidase
MVPVVVYVVSLVVFLAMMFAARALLTHQFYAVATGSMSPTIPPKSLVVVDPGRYTLGEPITFTHKGAVITHRYVGVNVDGTLVTKGDANATVDPFTVPPADVLGGVVASPAQLGYWLMYLKNPWGLASLVLFALLTYQVWVLFREPEDEDVVDLTDADEDVVDLTDASVGRLAVTAAL